MGCSKFTISFWIVEIEKRAYVIPRRNFVPFEIYETKKKKRKSVESTMACKLEYDSNEHLDRDDRGTSLIRWRHMEDEKDERENWLRIHACDDSDFSEPLSPAPLTRRTMSLETRDDRLKIIISLDRIVNGALFRHVVARILSPWLNIRPRLEDT